MDGRRTYLTVIDAFHVPHTWVVNCGFDDCEVCPATVHLGPSKDLLRLCRMGADQLLGFLRKRAGCPYKGKVTIKAFATVTELLALPAATPDVEGVERDYRDKVVSFLGT